MKDGVGVLQHVKVSAVFKNDLQQNFPLLLSVNGFGLYLFL